MIANGVARTPKKLRTSEGGWNKQRFSSIVSLFKMGTSLKGKNLLWGGGGGGEFFPFRSVPNGMENPFYLIRLQPLNVTIF